MSLSDELIDQYSRQILLPEVDYQGQERLLQAQVEVAGPEPWRSWLARYLRAAGVAVRELTGPTDQLTVEGGGRRWQRALTPGPAALTALGYLGAAVLLDLAQGEGAQG
ncbi:MAG: hypothetical protein K6U87_13025 [Firmicutes bacterium]|nr:hypothetical protein [Bacillota bacterium]